MFRLPTTWMSQSRFELSLARRRPKLLAGDCGMSTVEYAIGSIAAAALAAVLYSVVTGDAVFSGLETLIQRALSAPL